MKPLLRNRLKRRIPALLLLLSVAILNQPAAFADDEIDPDAPDCATIESCIKVVREYKVGPMPDPMPTYISSGIDSKPIQKALNWLLLQGDAGVVALLPLLDDRHPDISNRASYMLRHFEHIDPRHAPVLIAADRRGLRLLPVAIANTGTDEALNYLWADLLREPNSSSNSQTFFALSRFGDRLLPYLSREIESCQKAWQKQCQGVYELLREAEPQRTAVMGQLEAVARSAQSTIEARNSAGDLLINALHPFGLEMLKDDLAKAADEMEKHEPNPAVSLWGDRQFDVDMLIIRIGRYGRAGVTAGPQLARVLGLAYDRDTRASAALAMGQIGYTDGASSLLMTRNQWSDDWYLAYNAVESLARIGAERARPDIEKLATDHWFKPVRNNAKRALSMLDGGDFALPNGLDGRPLSEGDMEQWPITGSDFRYMGDMLDGPHGCGAAQTRKYSQYPVENLIWPRKAGDGYSLELAAPSKTQRLDFLDSYPQFRKIRGNLMFAAEMGDDIIVGTNAGEFGGEIYSVKGDGEPQMLIPDNAIGAFLTDRKLFVVTGLSHLMMSSGDLWVIERMKGKPTVTRRVRLPIEPDSIVAASGKILAINGSRGTVAMRTDGLLVDAEKACDVSSAEQ